MATPLPTPKIEPAQSSSAIRRKILMAGYVLIAVSFLRFGLTRDRYPEPHMDDSFFSYPAIRFLEGKGLNYNASPAAPYGDTIWAYHGPFFPRLQVVSLWLFGISEFSCRLPQYLAAHLALLVLFRFLVNRGLFLTSIVLVIVWFGDRSLQEMLKGRMEGIVLLFLCGAFVALVRAAKDGSSIWALLAGFCLGTASGFSPAAVCFSPFALAVLLVLSASEMRVRLAFALVIGHLFPLGVAAICWAPQFSEGVEQFRWHLHVTEQRSLARKFRELVKELGWSRWWYYGLCATTVLLVCSALRRLPRLLSGSHPDAKTQVEFAATVFSVAGLATVVGITMHAYYLVLFSFWPVIALASRWEPPRRRGFWLVAGCSAILFIAWAPSFTWNLFRVREEVLFYRGLDRSAASRIVAGVIPANARVTGSPEMLFIVRNAGRDFEPLPWFPLYQHPPPDQWLVLIYEDVTNLPPRVAPAELAARRQMYWGRAFPKIGCLSYPFVVYAPVVSAAARPPPVNPATVRSTPLPGGFSGR